MKSGCECWVSTKYSKLKGNNYLEDVIKADDYVAVRTLAVSFNI